MPRQLVLAALLALPVAAEVTARFVPLPLAASEASTGPAAEAGTWRVAVCNRGAGRVQIHREYVLETAPSIRFLDAHTAEALVGERTKRSRWAKWGTILALLGQAGAVAGLASGNGAATVGGGLLGLAVAIARDAGEEAQQAAPVYHVHDPLPARIEIDGGDCAEYTLLAARMRDARAIGPVPVRLPGSPQSGLGAE